MSTPEQSAFPHAFQPLNAQGVPECQMHCEMGITMRDYFAIRALQVVCSEDYGTIADTAKELGIPTNEYDCRKHWRILAARRAYAFADAFLAERSANPQNGGAS